jgi:hypothetical protein
MAVQHRQLWDAVKELVLEQYKGSPNLVGLIRAVVEESAQPLEDAAIDLHDALDIEKASGKWLDILGKLVCTSRNPGESDDDYRERVIVTTKETTAGTPDYAIKVAKILSGDPHPQYMDEATATFFVYDGPRPDGEGGLEQGGHQLSRAQVRKLAPAGVLGLPGASLKLCDGSLIGTTDKKLILTVAPDTTEPFTITFGFITNDGDRIVTNGGDRIVGTSTA